ncbi:helix-turn-helix domain-containing protein [Flavivirga algicola]|uniref:Helix-turn-helix domain-containing protein n=1 Tax=Flavivirga algicola TaxID=2729136 RepID=A0ABX1S1X9_9FLAO|nr:helix-turn-helix domain-containing protein [Flavivirga algicola]NMH89896.1 helix-turn-helix domain-containing protein [Flavivirga algicola]
MNLFSSWFSVLFTILICNSANCQGYRKDSLKGKTYKYLEKKFFKNQHDPKLASIYVDVWINKAKVEKDTFNLASAYLYKSYILEYKEAVKYSDSVLFLTRDYLNEKFPALGYMIRGYHHYSIGEDKKALDDYLAAYNYALKRNNINQQIEIQQFIGGMHYNSGNYNEAIKIFKNQYSYFESKPEFKIKNKADYLLVLDDLSKSYLRGKKTDSALIYTIKGIKLSLNNDNEMYSRFLLNSAISFYYKQDNSKALDSLNKVESMLDNTSLAICMYYKAKVFQKNDEQKSIQYFEKIDSIYKKNNVSFLELRDVYKSMFDYYSQNGTEKEQLNSVNKLIEIDSILDIDFKNINDGIIKNYEVPKLKNEKVKLEKELIKYKLNNKGIIYTAIITTLFFTFLLLNFYRKQKRYKKRFNEIINQQKKNNHKLQKNTLNNENNEIGISNEVISNILKQLEFFESKDYFTKNDITLNKLSKEFKTNTAYLSKVINHYKKESFSSYLSSLRIEYAIKELKNNKTFRNYTVMAMAKEIGFNNSESFSKAFYRKTGIYPSYFIKQLNQTSKKL